VIALVLGNQGDVLSGVLWPYYMLFGESKSWLTIIFILGLGLAGLLGIRTILSQCVDDKKNLIKYFISWCFVLLLLCIPQMLFLCLYTLIQPWTSAFSPGLVNRWEPMSFPLTAGWATSSEEILLGLLLISFIFLLMTRHRRLFIFIPWYLLLYPYLAKHIHLMPSKYLIYLSPFLAVLLTLFFIELPSIYFKKFWRPYRLGLYCLLFILLGANLFAIRWRYAQSLLMDYYWSYDYIKFSQLIDDDLRRFDKKNNQIICVQGLQDIPYAQKWQNSFLKDFNFSRYDSFRQTLASLRPSATTKMIINQPCPADARRYTIDDTLIRDGEGKSLEPFYQNFEEGLRYVQQKDNTKAILAFRKAAADQPFAMNFIFNFRVLPQEKEIILPATRSVIIEMSYHVEDDLKLHYVSKIFDFEVKDYGLSLLWIAYFENQNGHRKQSQEFLQQAALWVSKKGALDRYAMFETQGAPPDKDFINFVERNKDILSRLRIIPGVPVEYYHGYGIHWVAPSYYFAWSENERDFDLIKFWHYEYQNIFSARNKFDLRERIDHFFKKESPTTVITDEILYKNFKIQRVKDNYYVHPQKEKPSPSLEELTQGGARDSFKTPSLAEAEILVDQLSSW